MTEYTEQKKMKPTFDSVLEICENNEMKKVAGKFNEFLCENKMKPQWGAINSFNTSYKSRRVCILKISEHDFEIRVNTQYNQDFNECLANEDEKIKQFLLDSITYCFSCGTCKPGLDVELLGKQLTGACCNPVIRIVNPDGEYLELAKKLVLLRKKEITEDKAPKVTYIAKSKRV